MKKPILVAVAAIFAAAGAISQSYAALSDRDGTAWHPKSEMQVARRGDNRGYRSAPYKGGGYEKKGKIIRKYRPYRHFDHSGRADCYGAEATRSVNVCD